MSSASASTPTWCFLRIRSWRGRTRPRPVQMPSARQKTPYPPAAQLFFRLVVSLYDSALRDEARAGRLRSVDDSRACGGGCSRRGRNEWLTLAYAWNPLVVLEVALQRTHRRARRVVDLGGGVLDGAAANRAGDDRVRFRRRHEDSAGRARSTAVAANLEARRRSRRGAVRPAVSAVQRRAADRARWA